MRSSITWRQFCRLGIDQPVPHSTTLMKLTTRCGSGAVDGLNEARIAQTSWRIHAAGGVVRTKLRDRSRAAVSTGA